MKKLYGCLLLVALAACQESGQAVNKAEDPQEAGTQFIRASLDGDYKKAEFFLLKDTTNLMLFKKQQANYRQLSDGQKSKYKSASIRPVSINPQNDSTTLYKYYNTSNPGDTTVLRIVRRDSAWLVDLKSVVRM